MITEHFLVPSFNGDWHGCGKLLFAELTFTGAISQCLYDLCLGCSACDPVLTLVRCYVFGMQFDGHDDLIVTVSEAFKVVCCSGLPFIVKVKSLKSS